MTDVKRDIIIHCSATPEGKEFDVEDIRRWHKNRGWRDVGYHFVITLDGTVQEGRSIKPFVNGAHTIGHNRSIGICYIGGVDEDMQPKDTRTPEQKRALRELIYELKNDYPEATVYGHRNFAAKACPSFDAHMEYFDL